MHHAPVRRAAEHADRFVRLHGANVFGHAIQSRAREHERRGDVPHAGTKEMCAGSGLCEVAFEAAQRFASGLAFGELALQIELGRRVAARARDGDDVQGVVELSVAAAV